MARDEHRFAGGDVVDLRRSGVGASTALGAAATVSLVGGVHSANLEHRMIALGACLVFGLAGTVAVRSVSAELATVVVPRGGMGAAGVVRLLTAVIGYLVVAIVLLGLLAVPVGHLVLSGAITGVILGIAAQQSLANLFAGLLLLVSRPFGIGEWIVVNSGALGGTYYGQVRSIGLVYSTINTDAGPLNLPNAALMSAATGPRPAPAPAPDSDTRDESAIPRTGLGRSSESAGARR